MQNQGIASVEIAVVLGDSVVAVHHLSDPGAGRITSATKALFASAALGLAGCAVAMGIGMATAAENRRAERAWLDDGNAAIDFQPRRVPPALDLLAASGFIAAVGGAAWGLSRVHRERRPSSFRVGRGEGADLAVDIADVTVVAPGAAGFAFIAADGVRIVDGAAGPIALGSRVRAEVGSVGLLVSGVAAPRTAAAGPTLDRRALGYGLASAAVHAVLLILFVLIPATARGFSEDDLGLDHRMTRVLFRPVEEKPAPTSPQSSAASIGAEGERGRPDTTEHGKGKIQHVSDTPPSLAPPQPVTPERARTAGILGVMNAQRDPLTVVTATGDFTNGLDDADIRGSWDGPAYADNRGLGDGFKNHGPGGGGLDPNTIGAGPYHTPYTNMRLPPGHLPGRKPHPALLTIGQVTTPGGADKETIRRYVHARASRITFCYEHELVVKPSLAGTVVAEFTIRSDGRVLESKAQGFDPTVAQCVADVISGIAFPAGPVIHVTSYPFTFHPVGTSQ